MQSEKLQLKRATEVLVKSLGGIEDTAKLLGKGHSQVGRWVNRNDLSYSINLFDLREAEANAPRPLVTEALARLAGGVFIALPQAHGGDGALPGMAMSLAKEVGDVAGSLSAALADGVCTAAEAESALGELAELEQATALLRVALRGIAEKGRTIGKGVWA